MKIYSLICLFTFLSFIGATFRCLDIVKKYDIPRKKDNDNLIFTMTKTILVMIIPILHLVFLVGFTYIIFANEDELKEVLEED